MYKYIVVTIYLITLMYCKEIIGIEFQYDIYAYIHGALAVVVTFGTMDLFHKYVYITKD
jgi:hypothetical protein